MGRERSADLLPAGSAVGCRTTSLIYVQRLQQTVFEEQRRSMPAPLSARHRFFRGPTMVFRLGRPRR